MTQDMKQRETLVRVDDDDRRHKVNTAREIIYDKQYAVNSPAVDNLLKEQSLVPTIVSSSAVAYGLSSLMFYGRMPSPRNFLPSDSTYLSCFLLTLCMNLS